MGFGIRSAMVVPLVCRDRVLGALSLVAAESGRTYSKEDLQLAEDLAQRAAYHVDNARLYEERARVAQTLLDLGFGDKLIMFTDAIFDVGPRDARFGPGQLEELFADCSKRGVKAAADLIERAVLEKQGGYARDDVALVVVGVRTSIFRRVRSPRLWRSDD